MKLYLTSLLLAMVTTKAHASQATCRVNPDPHFLTFDGIYYDYHGGCDAVLIQNPTFDGVDEFNLHIRTVPFNGWGGISNAALQIGSDILEVKDDGTYLFNGSAGPNVNSVNAMGSAGYVFIYTTSGGGEGTSDVWEVKLNALQYVRITNFNWGSTAGSISIEVFADSSHFSNSVGMCGTWGTPGLIGRDGVIDYQGTPNAGNDMGLDWKVLPPPSEPLLFQIAPTATCTPGTVGGGEFPPGAIDEAERACDEVDEEEFNNCVFDVLTTGDEIWADAPHYFNYKCSSLNNKCREKRGKCVHRKDCDDTTHICNPDLCFTNNVPDWLLALERFERGARMRRLTDKEEPLEGNEGGKNGVRRRGQQQLSNDNQELATRNIQEEIGGRLSDFRDPCVCAIPRMYKSGKCCKYTGPTPFNCASIESLGPGADIDGRCNQVNGGNSCEWDYTDPTCCEIAMNDANCNLPTDEAIEQCKCALEKETA